MGAEDHGSSLASSEKDCPHVTESEHCVPERFITSRFFSEKMRQKRDGNWKQVRNDVELIYNIYLFSSSEC